MQQRWSSLTDPSEALSVLTWLSLNKDALYQLMLKTSHSIVLYVGGRHYFLMAGEDLSPNTILNGTGVLVLRCLDLQLSAKMPKPFGSGHPYLGSVAESILAEEVDLIPDMRYLFGVRFLESATNALDDALYALLFHFPEPFQSTGTRSIENELERRLNRYNSENDGNSE